MKSNAKNSIAVTTLFLLVYAVFASLPLPYGIIFLFFLITTAGLFWMVYSILTDTNDLSGKTFEEYFYEDSDQKRGM